MLSRELPAKPAYAQPVGLPKIAAGQDPKVLAAAALVALDKANRRITDFGWWYEGVRKDFRAGASQPAVAK